MGQNAGGGAGEFEIIAALRVLAGSPRSDLRVGSGDDAAVIDLGLGRLLLLSCDAQVEGVHFVTARIEPDRLGRRAAAGALSDIAAMGGHATHGLVSIIAPQRMAATVIEAVQRGIAAEMTRWGAAIVGGNLCRGPALSIELSVLGEVRSTDLLTRAGAREGDRLLVSGRLGAAAAGLRLASDAGLVVSTAARAEAVAAHERPAPRLDVARAIVRAGGATAAIDLSDGLAADLGHLLTASGVGAWIDAGRLPIAGSTIEVAQALGIDPLDLALHGGEDYELLLTAPAESVAALCAAVAGGSDVELTEIGEVRARGAGIRLGLTDGERALDPIGYRHF